MMLLHTTGLHVIRLVFLIHCLRLGLQLLPLVGLVAVLELGKLHCVGVEAGSTQLRRFYFLSDTVC
jgi:hypothetical protein